MLISQVHRFKSNNESLFLWLLFDGVQGHVLQGLHDSLSVLIFQIKASDEEACSIITSNSTATLFEIHVTKATGKLNMPPKGVNIPFLYKCNFV